MIWSISVMPLDPKVIRNRYLTEVARVVVRSRALDACHLYSCIDSNVKYLLLKFSLDSGDKVLLATHTVIS